MPPLVSAQAVQRLLQPCFLPVVQSRASPADMSGPCVRSGPDRVSRDSVARAAAAAKYVYVTRRKVISLPPLRPPGNKEGTPAREIGSLGRRPLDAAGRRYRAAM